MDLNSVVWLSNSGTSGFSVRPSGPDASRFMPRGHHNIYVGARRFLIVYWTSSALRKTMPRSLWVWVPHDEQLSTSSTAATLFAKLSNEVPLDWNYRRRWLLQTKLFFYFFGDFGPSYFTIRNSLLISQSVQREKRRSGQAHSQWERYIKGAL